MDEYYSWIEEHINNDPAALRLKYSGKRMPFDVADAILQIECRRKYAKKLRDTLAAFPRFRFPNALSGEQSTSDLLAGFHATLIPEGATVVDLTSGLGIDALHLAKLAAEVTAVERQSDLVEALRFNASGLGTTNVSAVCADCHDFIREAIAAGRIWDVAFIDPARRSADGSRVFALSECEPDVVTMMPDLAKICRRLIIKASPMLDISHTIGELDPTPAEIISLGTPTECKELVAVVIFGQDQPAGPDDVEIRAVTLSKEKTDEFDITRRQEQDAPLPHVYPGVREGDYVYEPYPAVMKIGANRLLATRFALLSFHANTRLYYSPVLQTHFPGECFRVEKVLPYASKHIKRFRKEYPRISVATRNFGLSADALRSKLGVSDGGDMRVYGVTDGRGERLLIVCAKG